MLADLRTGGRADAPSRPPLAVMVALGATVVALGALVALDVRLAALAVVGVAVAYGVLERPARGGLLLAVLVPPLSGLREGFGVPGMRPTELAIAGIGGLVLLGTRRTEANRWTALDWAAGVFAIGGTVLAAVNVVLRGDSLGAEAIPLLAPLQFLVLYRVVAVTLTDRADRERAVRWLLLGSVPVSIVAMLQQLDVGGTRALVASLTGDDIFSSWSFVNFPRATGLFPFWHTLAGYLLVIILLGLAALTAREPVLPRTQLGVVLTMALAALVLSQVFTSLIMVIVGAVLLLRWRGALRHVGWMVAAGLIAFLLFGSLLTDRLDREVQDDGSGPAVPSTLAYRGEVWREQYAPVIARHGLMGYGTGVPDVIDWQYTESGYLTLVLRGGVPLLVAYGAFQVAAARRARAVDRAWGTAEIAPLAALATTVVLVPMNLVWPYINNSGLAQPYWIVLGLVAAVGTAPPEPGPEPEGEAEATIEDGGAPRVLPGGIARRLAVGSGASPTTGRAAAHPGR